MKTVPSYIWESGQHENLAENELFKLLAKTDLDEKGIAFHSMNLRGDRKQSWYEIDFLIITQSCVYGIEVKTGFLSSHGGEWHIHRPNGEIAYSKKKSPYIQAKDATLHWRDSWLSKKFPEAASRLDFVYIAALYMNDPASLDALNCPELPREVILGQTEFHVDGLKRCLERAKRYHQTKSKTSNSISKEDVEHIAAKLRPSLEQSFPIGLKNFLLNSQEQLTEEQYNLVDALESFERLVIDGGAGTGKTFVLAHLVRKDAAQGKHILVVVKPNLLRDKIRVMLTGLGVTILSPDEIPEEIERKFDVLYVDEGQDLCDENTLLTLDSVLTHGIEKSRWRWFGDFQNQRGRNVTFSEEVFDLLRSMTGNSAIYPLRRNVRNTPNLVKWLEHICHARMGETVMKGAGPEVNIEYESDIETIVDEITQDPVLEVNPIESIVAIFPENYIEAFSNSMTSSFIRNNAICIWGSEEFKGLEAEIVMVWVPLDMNDSDLKEYLYKSVSRARALCKVVTKNKKELIKQLSRLIRLES